MAEGGEAAHARGAGPWQPAAAGGRPDAGWAAAGAGPRKVPLRCKAIKHVRCPTGQKEFSRQWDVPLHSGLTVFR